VARSDYADPTGATEVFGMVSTLDAEGHVIEEVATPHPEITGITIRNEGETYLYITEASSRSVFRLKVTPE
jgi:sugar lactone lactonase YvrE